jgi:hypothetical protein
MSVAPFPLLLFVGLISSFPYTMGGGLKFLLVMKKGVDG